MPTIRKLCTQEYCKEDTEDTFISSPEIPIHIDLCQYNIRKENHLSKAANTMLKAWELTEALW